MSHENTYYNRKYKDSLFRFIFNSKEAALSLYNAINDSVIMRLMPWNSIPERFPVYGNEKTCHFCLTGI